MKIVSSRRFALWTRELLRWLSRKFDSISIDLTPVENKLDDVKSDVADVKTAVENIDFSTLAKQGDNPAATNSAILEALSHINPQDPNSKALAEFFGVTLLQGYEFMTDTEVTDELEDIMQALDSELTAEQAASITAQAMQIINDDEEQS